MTEEERQRTILELESAIGKPPPSRKPRVEECECCGQPLINGECEDHPSYVRMHQQALDKIRRQYK